VLVLLEVVVGVGAAEAMAIWDGKADFVTVVVLDADRDDDAVMVGKAFASPNLRSVSLPS
jgi:hypothetical protein